MSTESKTTEALALGAYNPMPITELVSLLKGENNPVRAGWEVNPNSPDAVSMGKQIVASGKIVDAILAYQDGEIADGHRRWLGAMAIILNPQAYGLETLDGITGRLEVIERGDPAQDLVDSVIRNVSIMTPADFVVSYALLAGHGFHSMAIGDRLGHGRDMASIYGKLAESASDAVIGMLAAGRLDFGSLREIAAYVTDPEERARVLDNATSDGAAMALINYKALLAAKDEARRPGSAEETEERVTKARDVVERAKAEGKSDKETSKKVAAVLAGREENPPSISAIRNDWSSHNSPDNPIAVLLLGWTDGYLADSDKAVLMSALQGLMAEGTVASTARAKIMTLLRDVYKRRGTKAPDVRQRSVGKKAAKTETKLAAKKAPAKSAKGNGKAETAKGKATAKTAAAKKASKKAPAEAAA